MTQRRAARNRARLLFEILHGVRQEAGDDFQIGLRLSMERYGLLLAELRDVAAEAIRTRSIDYLDLAPWDVDKVSTEPGFAGRRIIDVFTELPRHGVRIGASSDLVDSARAESLLGEGCDFVMLGRASITEPEFPNLVTRHGHHSVHLPVRRSQLTARGHSRTFVDYLLNYRGFAA